MGKVLRFLLGPLLRRSPLSPKNLTAADIVWYSALTNYKGMGFDVTFSAPQQKFIAAVAAIPSIAAFNKDAKRNPALWKK